MNTGDRNSVTYLAFLKSGNADFTAEEPDKYFWVGLDFGVPLILGVFLFILDFYNRDGFIWGIDPEIPPHIPPMSQPQGLPSSEKRLNKS